MTSDLFGDDGRLGRRFWLLGLAQAAHSMEEMRARPYDFMWIATERLGLPRMGMSSTTFALVNMGIIAFLLGTAPRPGGVRALAETAASAFSTRSPPSRRPSRLRRPRGH